MTKIQKEIQGKIESCEQEASGSAKRQDGSDFTWIRYKVMIGGNEFKTFDKTFLTLIDKEGAWKYDEEDRVSSKGKAYISRTLLTIPKVNNQQVVIDKLDEILSILKGGHEEEIVEDDPADYAPVNEEDIKPEI